MYSTGFAREMSSQGRSNRSIEQNTPPRYVSGVSTNVGTRATSSNFLAYTALTKPASENSVAVSSATSSVSSTCCTATRVNSSDTPVTTSPTQSPRSTPPDTYPSRITQLDI